MKFEVLANKELVGYSDLECGDPPMGVVHGIMVTTGEYDKFRVRVIAAAGGPVVGVELTVMRATRSRSGELK